MVKYDDISISDTLNNTMAAGDVVEERGRATKRRRNAQGEYARYKYIYIYIFCRPIGAQANASSTAPTSQLQGAARTPALL